MHILTVYANPNPRSFCHAILERFTRGLADAGHTNETVDLYAIRFNPVFRLRDFSNWVGAETPVNILKGMLLHNSGGRLRRYFAERILRNMSSADIARLAQIIRPGDVVEQQRKVARAQGLALIYPVWFMGMPAILKGWIERVFTYGFAFSLAPEGWKGDIGGRIPLFKHEKALLISTTMFDEASYQDGIGAAMQQLIDDFGFRYPGVKEVEHVYFYSVGAAGAEARRCYLEQAYRLGLEY